MTDFDHHWPSTKAMSVYNALSLSGCDMTADEMLGFLRLKFCHEVSPDYVSTGIGFLAKRGLIQLDGDKLRIERNASGRGRTVVRVKQDRDLSMLQCWDV